MALLFIHPIEPSELSRWLCRGDSAIKIVFSIIIIIIIIVVVFIPSVPYDPEGFLQKNY